jgi:hypothetical protein
MDNLRGIAIAPFDVNRLPVGYFRLLAQGCSFSRDAW